MASATGVLASVRFRFAFVEIKTRVGMEASGNVRVFDSGKQVARYLGLVPLEQSSGKRRRLGTLRKRGVDSVFLLVEAAQPTVRSLPEWHSEYLHRGLRVKTLRGSGCDRLLPPVPVTQCRKKKDSRHAGQSASDKENAVGVNEAVRGAQTFDLSARKPLQDLSQPSIG